MPNCSAPRTSPSCAAPRIRKNWWQRAAQLGYRALALTDECSLAGVVRAHVEAKKQGLHLVIGSQFQLTNEDGGTAFALIVLAQNREGYGNLSELITLARTRAAKGSYRLTPARLRRARAGVCHICAACRIAWRSWRRATASMPTRLARSRRHGWRATFPARAWLGLDPAAPGAR